jgi:4-diphosphocytidyl-2-C-methyl-D-erythritol kinase
MNVIRAYAKINLGLRIVRKREDGYHDIETVFHRINIFDEISFSASATVSCSTSSEEIPGDEQNLCMRAARAFQTAFSPGKGVHIDLRKNIPIGAGLGGGSSDAAAVLTGLNKIWNLGASVDDLYPLAVRLGSDVPYFLKSGSAYATSRGEVLEYFPVNLPYWILLVTPDIQVSTPWAYANLHAGNGHARAHSGKPDPESSLKSIVIDFAGSPGELTRRVKNDFEPLVLKAYPAIAWLKENLTHTGAEFVQLSGSGSSVYGFFRTEPEARAAAERFPPPNRVFLTPPNFLP